MSTPEPGVFAWHTSSYTAGNGNCVEVAETSTEVRVRDTKDRDGGQLAFDRAPWRAFLTSGDVDR
ncbi:DUF397 domain-containing protein [Amycolatopsis sp. H20-H5]|uniref:DUF397 domain-containing protein n=1 Tax=Amycolatopsis sp. H20-H5 TaxID=3046309 RepID=UPI002DB77736|nr:DUF397 domain-containing protein [Amycolatopsis sp. H20-H5]MEC3977782.1 DUF397 domain-containing protein [Amycolatopsis sp. H20-H5]